MGNSAGVSRKAEEAYPAGAPGSCTQFLVESELLLCFCYFVCIILVLLCSLWYLSVFHIWFLFLDSIILVPLITLSLILHRENIIIKLFRIQYGSNIYTVYLDKENELTHFLIENTEKRCVADSTTELNCNDD